jgi:hypothetical protein
MATPTIVFFGEAPTKIIMQSSSQFTGSAQTGTPTLSPGAYLFPVQAGGGLYNMHELVGCQESITVVSITYAGGGTLTINRQNSLVASPLVSPLGTIAASGDLNFQPGEITIAPGEELLFTTTGATNPVVGITGMLANRTRRN